MWGQPYTGVTTGSQCLLRIRLVASITKLAKLGGSGVILGDHD
jgi:hypothetical protein